MAIPVARVHLKVAHALLPALLPTPPEWKMLPLLATPFVAAILPKPLANEPSRADTDKRWDAHKAKPACPASSGPRSADSVRSCAGHGSSSCKNATSPPPNPGRADSVERWDAHKKERSPASSSSSSSVSSFLASSSNWPVSRATSAERWDAHKKRRPAPLDDGESSSTGSNDDMDTEEEILWKPRAMYAGPGFVVAAQKSTMLPMPTAFLVPDA